MTTKLPYYMVPTKIISIEKIPINYNGKLDSKKLLEYYSSASSTDKYFAKDEIEKQVELILNKSLCLE